MRRIGERSIWMGNFGDVREPRRLLAAGIEAVIELADNEQLAVLPRDLIRCRFPLSDSGASPLWLYRLAAETIASLIRARTMMLVCCSAGMNRSPCIIAAAISLTEARPLDEALEIAIRDSAADISPLLLSRIRACLSE